MATMREYMIADFTRTLDESGVSAVIDGVETKFFLRLATPAEFAGGRFDEEGLVVEAKYLFVNAADLAAIPRERQVMEVDGVKYTVGLVDNTGVSLKILLFRYLS
jgi:hypothetical protein